MNSLPAKKDKAVEKKKTEKKEKKKELKPSDEVRAPKKEKPEIKREKPSRPKENKPTPEVKKKSEKRTYKLADEDTIGIGTTPRLEKKKIPKKPPPPLTPQRSSQVKGCFIVIEPLPIYYVSEWGSLIKSYQYRVKHYLFGLCHCLITSFSC